MDFTLSQKERMLLEDLRSHEQLCIEKYSNYANQASCNQLKQIFKACEQSERTHLDSINQLLSGTIPQMNQQNSNQQQSQASGQNAGNQAQSGSNQQKGFNASDASLCQDMLSTEKYVSGTYDTAIFEFRDTRVRDVLNHIQKEEQKHGESIFQYMQSKGMYKVQ